MPHPHHDRLDLKLQSRDYMNFPCGSMNLGTSLAEYCGYDCPTLVARMQRGEDVTVAIPPLEPAVEPTPAEIKAAQG